MLKEDGLLSKAASLLTEDSAAYPDDSLLNSEDEFPSAQIQRSTDKPRKRQEKQPPNSPKTRRLETTRGSYEHPPKKRTCQFHQENAENVEEKIRKSETSISTLKAHFGTMS